MKILVIEAKPVVAKQIVGMVEGHKLVDMTDHSLSQKDVDTLGEDVVVACSKICDDVDDVFSLVFCKRADESQAAECGVPAVIGMTEKSREKDKRTIKKAIDE